MFLSARKKVSRCPAIPLLPASPGSGVPSMCDVTGKFVPSGMRENPLGGKRVMPNKRYKPEQIVTMLRQIEVGIANGKTTPQACKEAEITIQTFYRWRKEYGGLKMDQAKRLKELEKENGKLKRLVADLSLDKQILKDIAEGNF